MMEVIGENIEKLQTLINTPMIPPPNWIRKWQTEAEHVLFLAHLAKDRNDLNQLKVLDFEALQLVKTREAKK